MKRAARGEAMAEARDSVPVVADGMVSGATSGFCVAGPDAFDSSTLGGPVVGASGPGGGGSSSASALGSWPSQTLPIGQPLQA